MSAADRIKSRPSRAEDVEMKVAWKCDCQRQLSAGLKHYELARCACGLVWTALQPERHGPFVAYRWPGDYRTPAPTPHLTS